MQRHYDFDAIHRDVARALETALARHGIDRLYAPLAVAAVLEAVASPLKLQQTATPLTAQMGRAGTEAYLASRLPRAVELLKSPHSRIVNPMMDAIADSVERDPAHGDRVGEVPHQLPSVGELKDAGGSVNRGGEAYLHDRLGHGKGAHGLVQRGPGAKIVDP